ncbi:MAG: DUF4260 domain-containing protein [Flavobacteriales bacterium]|nr:DUF4260 domain-containing protein [Flavobacteriales bacterium]
MKNLLRLEELAQFLLCLGLLIASDVAWWVYLLLLLGPDIGMLGYMISPRTGAATYNLLHHKAVALALFLLGGIIVPEGSIFQPVEPAFLIMIAAVVLYGHASLDRIFGYGLKFGDNFHHTHLGWIGKSKSAESAESEVR